MDPNKRPKTHQGLKNKKRPYPNPKNLESRRVNRAWGFALGLNQLFGRKRDVYVNYSVYDAQHIANLAIDILERIKRIKEQCKNTLQDTALEIELNRISLITVEIAKLIREPHSVDNSDGYLTFDWHEAINDSEMDRKTFNEHYNKNFKAWRFRKKPEKNG